LNARLQAYAARHGIAYADYWRVLATPEGEMKPQYSEDGVHVNAAGYEAIRPIAVAAIARARRGR
jgi:lysophospholipase L1-like esterase